MYNTFLKLLFSVLVNTLKKRYLFKRNFTNYHFDQSATEASTPSFKEKYDMTFKEKYNFFLYFFVMIFVIFIMIRLLRTKWMILCAVV